MRVRIPLAVVLSLLVGAVAGIVAYRYAATGGKPRTAPPAPVTAPALPAPGATAAVSNKPAVLRVDPQLIDGKMHVTITLDQPVPYDAHRLDHPDRVYIDLHGARLAPELAGKTLFVNKGGVSDIRMAQTQPDTVRVVLDLEKRSDYSVAQQTNPPALVLKLTPRPPTRSKRHAASTQPKKTSPQ
ncbi:MAG TPA: AMIN domain-containing protein [Terriglobales bacterium]|nr:AMIN domain-containing protein [Terriglobales bacterium]